MLTAIAFCPATPLLIRELNGRHDSVPDLRAACHHALAHLAELRPEHLIVLGSATTTDHHTPPGHCFTATPGDPLWSLRIAQRLLTEASWHTPITWQTLAHHAPPTESAAIGHTIAQAPQRVAVLALANGSACRTVKAPGYFDPRAEAFDTHLVTAIQHGDHHTLTDLDPTLATDLLVDGQTTLHAIGTAIAETAPPKVATEPHYADAPFGVQYFVANWLLENG